MERQTLYILSLNCGSSSIKFSVFALSDPFQCVLKGRIQGIGESTTSLSVSTGYAVNITAENQHHADEFLINWLEDQIDFRSVVAAGHRIVHGMMHTETELITQSVLEAIQPAAMIDPDHMPGALGLIGIISTKYPAIKQIACYDTAFHKNLPQVVRNFALPQDLTRAGIKRYGFHGLSYSYLLEKLRTDIGGRQAAGRLILMHLGSGASMAAVSNFNCIDTTMGFTPAGGVMMGTRCGDLDPGIILYLMQKQGLDMEQLNQLLNKKSGLLGVSGRTADMQKLLSLEKTDSSAAEAIGMFCYQIKKNLCAYIGILGGVDAVVFTGGIGENVPQVRSRVCSGLKFLGIELDPKKNSSNEFLISAGEGIPIYVIKTDEEYMIGLLTRRWIDQSTSYKSQVNK